MRTLNAQIQFWEHIFDKNGCNFELWLCNFADLFMLRQLLLKSSVTPYFLKKTYFLL